MRNGDETVCGCIGFCRECDPDGKRQGARHKTLPRECSAQIGVDGRVNCDCMKGRPELKADLALCYSKLTALLAKNATPSG